ncbi:hypothetical protein BJX99DRAFT_261462 [Aspergillus californicus]
MAIDESGNLNGVDLADGDNDPRPSGRASISTFSSINGIQSRDLNGHTSSTHETPSSFTYQDVRKGWQTGRAESDFVAFPALPVGVQQPFPDQTFKYQVPGALHEHRELDAVTVVLGAWGLVVGAMVESNAHVFGIAISTRKSGSHTDHAETPMQVNCIRHQSLMDYLRQIQVQRSQIDLFPQGLSDEAPNGREAASFQTLLEIGPQGNENAQIQAGEPQEVHEPEEVKPYALVLDVRLSGNEMIVTARFDSRIIERWLVRRLVERLDDTISQICNAGPEAIIASIENVTPKELEEIWQWNRDVPAAAERCISEVIEERARGQPSAPAICAWDGSLSYGELDRLTTMLATQLVGLGVGPEVFVSLVFEKSMWTAVATLGVLKAGGAFVLLDTSLPEQRLQDIVRQVKPKIALSSPCHHDLSTRLVEKVLTVTAGLLKPTDNASACRQFQSRATPSSAAYAIFTAGRTGTPKGIVITNQNMASVFQQADRLGFKPDSRVYDFASYSFGLSLLTSLPTLAAGACLCVPSDQDRKNNLAKSIQSLGANVIWLTPTAAQALSPSMVPGLRMIGFGGEVAQPKDIQSWWGHAEIRNGYGSSETTTLSVLNFHPSTASDACHLGTGTGMVPWIVDPENHDILLPIGCVGELLVEGPHIGRGYLNDPTRTMDSFIEDPDWLLRGSNRQPGRHGRLYKTGDLVRYTECGRLVFIGRKDMQVKMRGQRVELGEVEHWVQEFMPEATHVVAEVIVPPGNKPATTLVAFLEVDSCGKEVQATPPVTVLPIPADVEDRLREHLPSYMVPSVFFTVSKLPIGPTGKRDRNHLRNMASSFSAEQLAEMRTMGRGPKRQPTGELERQMQGIWAQVLNMKPTSIGIDDSFFQLGGTSINAMIVGGEARKIGLDVTAAHIFLHRTLCKIVKECRLVDDEVAATIPYSKQHGPVLQSFAQERVWFLEQLHPGRTWYHMACTVRFRGLLQLNALQAAIHALENRHETLRTTFMSKDGVSLQTIHPFNPNVLAVVDHLDEDGLVDALKNDQRVPFDLTKEPGWRVKVFRLSNEDHVLSLVIHHIICDGWSVDVLRKELGILYSAALQGHDPLSQLDPLPVRYQDYSIWQRQKDQIAQQQPQLEYWVNELRSSRPAEFSCDKPRPAALSGMSGQQEVRIEGLLFDNLQRFCKEHDVTPFIVLLAAFRSTHYRLTYQNIAAIGCPNANRDRWELKDMIGFFVNMQCYCIRIDGQSFREVVHQVEGLVTAAIANQDVPFERIVANLQNDRDMSRNPLAQTIFALHPQININRITLEGLDATPIPFLSASRFDLEFHLYQEEAAFQGGILYSTDLFNPETISNLLSVFCAILEQGLSDPDTPVASLPLLTKTDFDNLKDMGLVDMHETPYPRELNVLDVFRQQVGACPNRIAVKDSSAQLTYAELDLRSETLADWLSQRQFPAQTLIGILGNRSCETIVSIIGILKANLAYLPFEVKVPASRMETILSSIQGDKLVLVGSHVQAPHIQLENVEFVQMADTLRCPGVRSGTFTAPSPTSLAYVMFTSGSTGTPKGVMIEHRNIIRLAKRSNMMDHIPPNVIMGHISSLAFDASTWEIYSALLNGGTLVCIEPKALLDTRAVARTFAQERVQAIFITPILLKQYLRECPEAIGALEALVVGGDRLDCADMLKVRELMAGEILNGYGPTENTSFSTFYRLQRDNYGNGVPIGRSLSNSAAYVMDPKLRLVPLGVVGELVVTGDGLARGYTDPQRNVDAFVSVTIGDRNMRAYRTGDYVRYRAKDGQLEILGRGDGQVKIRGQRVELGEVEHILRSHGSVSNAVVMPADQDQHINQLVAVVTIEGDQGEDGSGDVVESEHHEEWEERFDSGIYLPMDTVDAEKIGRDFIGWTSMYDGRDIDKGEMNEWLDDTMEAILNGGEAGHVLEIGSGSGMILFNLGKGLQSYIGLDPSERAVKFIIDKSKAVPALAGRVRMLKATAAEISRLECPMSPDLAIINSVAQYFPSESYLFKFVESLLQLPSVRTIFFGDIRSHALRRQFLASRALHLAEEIPSKDYIRMMVDRLEDAEPEFLTDPAFFTALPDRFPDLVEHVEILPKRMMATNELSCYRYAAVIHAKDHGKETLQVYGTDDAAWIDFMGQGHDRESLLQLLQRPTSPSIVAVSNIPHSKTIFERFVVESLDHREEEAQDPGSWLSDARQQGQDCPSLSSVDLVELAQEAGFRVEISWARQYSQSGGFDAIFHRHRSVDTNGQRVLFRFPTDHQNRPFGAAISTRPLRREMEKLQVELSHLVEAHLPSYMVPQKIAILDEIPLNNNGKVDRQVLRKLIQTWTADHGPVQQPTSEPQLQMQRIWAEVLNENPSVIGVDANFFKLGGNSIAAMKVAAEACKIGFGIAVADIFRYPQLDQLCRQKVRSSTETSAVIPRTQQTGPVEQSFAQGRIWFIEELHPGTTSYLMPRATRLRGPLQVNALHTALRAVENRHETLRTTFTCDDNRRLQEVQPLQAKDLNIICIPPGDQQGLEVALERDRTTLFDLKKEPGWRVSLYKLAEDDHILSVAMHHIVSDGWSVDILCRELGAFYSSAIRGQDPLSKIQPLPIQYRDYSVWQRTSDQIANHEEQLQYWIKQLRESRPAELLCDKPRPTALSGDAGLQVYRIEGLLYEKLLKFCQTRGITPFIALLTVFRVTQFRLSGQQDATIGILNANRHYWELKDMIGFFVNMQCVRTKIEGETFEELLQQVHQTVTEALLNQDVPFDVVASKIQRGRDLSRNPLAQLVFVVHSQLNLGQLELEGIEAEILPEPPTSAFDLEFHFYPVEGGLRGEVVFSTDLYLPESIRNLLSVFHSVLEEALEKPHTMIKFLPSMTPDAFSQLDQMDLVQIDRHSYPRMLSVADLFRQQAEACGARTAVRDSSTELTYRTRSFPAETLVGVFADRCCETIVAFLGILKANLAYLPFDIKTPTGRMETILSSIPGETVVLVGPGIQAPSVQLEKVQFVSLGEVLAGINTNSLRPKPPSPTLSSPTSLAYVMFTSGSTGNPKGVMVEHRGIVRLVKQSNMARYLHAIPIVAHLTNIAFDVSTWEIYSALLNGGTLICIEYMTLLDHQAMADIFARERVETAIFAPALLKQRIHENTACLAGLDTLFVAGDRADARDLFTARRLVQNVINAYGPTENTVISTLYCVPDGEDCVNGVPIGRSVTNSGAYVVDEKQRIVPLGLIGELVVTGDGLARGYTDPLHNDRFITVDVGGEPVRGYRTGDYVRYRPVDGQLEFFGRMDGQVKIRGHRIELGEIEHALRTHESVQDAAVVLHEEAGQEPELAGFVTVDQRDTRDHAQHVDAGGLEVQLQKVLRHQLPPYMIPRYLTVIAEMPVNINGKVDRHVLADRLRIREPGPAAQRQPATEEERQMQSIWAKVLRIDLAMIGLDDDLFLLGANSIAAMNVVAEARKIGMNLEVADVFKCPTLAELASLQSLGSVPAHEEHGPVVLCDSFAKEALLQQVEILNPGIGTEEVEDIFPVTSFQQEFILHGIRSRQFCNYFYLDFSADVDLPSLEKSCLLAAEKFPLLRSSFLPLSGKFWQILLRRLDQNLHVVDVSEDLDSFFHRFCVGDARDFTPTQPPFAFTALKQTSETCRLVLRMTHAQYDGLSLPIIAETIIAGYRHAASPEIANFALFLSYAHRHRAESIKYWRELLRGSSPITTQSLRSPLLPRGSPLDSVPKDLLVEAETGSLKLPSRITFASLASAAWAVLLSRVTGQHDIVYGHLVAGRNASVRGIDRVVGPCVNIIPIRVKLAGVVNAIDLLHSVQDQLIAPRGADSLGFKDIIEECTDWPPCPNFDFVIQHQNVDERPVLEFPGAQHQLQHWLNPERTSPFKVFMISYPQGDRLRINLIANTHIMSPASAKVLLGGLVKLIEMMAHGGSVSSSFSIEDVGLGVE